MKLPRIIFWLIMFGLITNLIKLYNAQVDSEYITLEEVYPWYFRLGVYGNFCISIASILSFLSYKKYFPSFVSTCYILIMVFVFIASFDDLYVYQKQPSFFYSIKGLGTFINFGILFFAAETKYFPKLLKFFYYVSFALILASFISFAKVGFGSGRREYLNAVRMFAVYLIWVFPFFFLQDEEDKRKSLINTLAFLAIFLIILATGSRSYLISYFIYVGLKFRVQLRTKNAVVAILGGIVLAGVGYFLLINSNLGRNFDNVLSNLSERTNDDSRSDQLIDFFSQYDPDYLIQGVGPVKKWYWNSISSYYDFLDNQIILIAWWAGLPTVLTYVYLFVRSLFVKSEILLFENIKSLKLIIGMWVLACLGFAIYCTICCDLYYYFISLILGLTVCQYSKIMDPAEMIETVDE